MHSACRLDNNTLQPLSPPETVVPEIPPRIDNRYQSSPASLPSNNGFANSATDIPQIQNQSTESASLWRATFANIGNKGISVFRRLRVPRRKHVGASDQHSPKESRPADHDGLPTTTLAPVSSRTISGHGDAGRLDVDPVSRSRGGQPSTSADHPRSVSRRLISSTGPINRIFRPRGARKTHHQLATVPSPMLSSQRHPSDIPPPPTNVLHGRTWQETGSDTASQLLRLEEGNQNQDALRQVDPPRKRRYCAQQDNSTPYNGPPAGTFTHLPQSPNLPGAFASPSSPAPARPLTRTVNHWICTPGGPPSDEPETLWFGSPSESSHPSDKDDGMALPDEHGPKNPSVKPTRLPHSPNRTAASAEFRWHQPVAPRRHLDKDNCRVQENEGLYHEAKRVAGEPDTEEKRELPARPEEPEASQGHYIEMSSSTPHLEVDPIPTRVSDITPHLTTLPSIPVEQADSFHASRRYEPSPAHLHDAGGSQVQGPPKLVPDPSLPPGRMVLSIGPRHQAYADAQTEASASFNICNGAPALSRHKRLRNCQRTPSEEGELPVVSYRFSDPGSSDEEVTANVSEDDNCQVYFDVDGGSSNDPGSLKTISKRSFSIASMTSTRSSNCS